ncbi:MAG TPA: MBL fold metallo-hydrolase [Gemmatimonadaceae bacterium]|nr:MBL fold metallo-hydrolase [Gemmatimonadaceae bacterium]
MTLSSGLAHHLPGGRFGNPWPGPSLPGFGGILRWTLERAWRGRFGLRAKGRAPAPVPSSLHSSRSGTNELRVSWIGHSTFLLQIGGLNVLTDPMFSKRASPVRWAGPRRLTAPGIALEALPPIDLILQSHDHYDHFDDASIRALAIKHPQATWCAPLGLGDRLRARGVSQIVERDWFETAAPCSGGAFADTKVTCTPARHFSGRGLADRNATLWCGWVVETAAHRAYFVGDTAHHRDFGEIGRKCGPFDLVLMPIGAYDPRWFMRPVHMDPEEAVAAYASIVEAQTARGENGTVMAAMHWGTFVLTDEPVDEPPRRAQAAWAAHGFSEADLWLMAPGETRTLGR